MRNVLFLAAPALALIATPAIAAETATSDSNVESFAVEVEHNDIDLTTQSGVALLETRIKRAIRSECDTGRRDARSIAQENACRETALASTMPQVELAIAAATAERARLAATSAPSAGDKTGA